MRLLVLLCVIVVASAQYTSQTYPDPRIDPLTCRLPFASYVCDPSGVLGDDDRVRLMQKINQVSFAMLQRRKREWKLCFNRK
ncbi:unnamed protein product [Haemonchus placei]|uniref:Uncharacterized protein n=1 Tax=Haemonchus placei TaxID=6290 RepID=A0A0N4X711_HAEPC|nr:unnamed protein product [Haemonchus placei]